MSTYRVTWEIDIDAPDAKQAASTAREIQLSKASIATVFKVAKWSERRRSKSDPVQSFLPAEEIDLSEEGI